MLPLLISLTGCGTSKKVIEAAARQAAAEQAQLNAENTAAARDLIRDAAQPLPPECNRRVRAGLNEADKQDPWRVAAKYERALVRSNNRLQSCTKLQADISRKVVQVADELAAQAEGQTQPTPEDLQTE